jgi:hypothetical protein
MVAISEGADIGRYPKAAFTLVRVRVALTHQEPKMETRMRPQLYRGLLSMLALCTASLMGCGGGHSGSDGVTPSPSNSAASDPAPASAPAANNSRIDNSLNATQCITLTPPGDITKNILATNTCSVKVWMSWCNALPDSTGYTGGLCKAHALDFSPTGYAYDVSAWTLSPGESFGLSYSSGSGNHVFLGACVYQAPAYATSHIVQFDSATIATTSKASFICYKNYGT